MTIIEKELSQRRFDINDVTEEEMSELRRALFKLGGNLSNRLWGQIQLALESD